MLVSSELAQMMSQYVKCGRTMALNIVFDKSTGNNLSGVAVQFATQFWANATQ